MLSELRQQGMEAWANGEFPTPHENSFALGGIACYTSLLTMDYHTYAENMDDKYERPTSNSLE
jgi:hypothetical protein